MKFAVQGLSVVLLILLTEPAMAQDDAPSRGRRFQDPEFRQRMLDQFDKDGNGVLDEAERQAARESFRERFGRGRPDDRRGPGGPPAAEGRERRGRPDGPPRRAMMRNLEPLFGWFDANDDGMLSVEEFHDLAHFVQGHLPGPPERGRAGRGFDRRGPEGPPPPRGFGRRGPESRPWGDGPPGRRSDSPPNSDVNPPSPQQAEPPVEPEGGDAAAV